MSDPARMMGDMGIELATFEGCLLGHALGDALGAPVEFVDLAGIVERYGPHGLRTLEPWDGRPAGSYTDDTQLMLATARALLDAAELWEREQSADPAQLAWAHYTAWCETQNDSFHARRPGQTCLDSIRSGHPGDTFDPINDRKGAGGIMRVAPVGLLLEPDRAFEVAVDLAALTHGHPSGYLAAGVYADIVARIVRGAGTAQAVAGAREQLLGWEDDAVETLDALDLAVELFMSDAHPGEAIALIGEGWVAEEALGIAVYCALSYPEDWTEGVLAAVNITGDSDTTGCLTGALLGTALGQHAIPGAWLDRLEGSGELVGAARALWQARTGHSGSSGS